MEKGLASDKPEAAKRKRSRLAASLSRQSSPADALPPKCKTGAAAAAREAKRKAGAGGLDKAARRRVVQTRSPSGAQAHPQKRGSNAAEHTDEGLQEDRPDPQMRPAEHAQKVMKSVKAPPAAQPAGTTGLKSPANSDRRNGSAPPCQGAAAPTEQQQTKPKEEALTCLQASPIDAKGAADWDVCSRKSPGRATFPSKDWDLIYEKLRQNSSQYRASQKVSQSQSPDKAREMKGKGKMRASEELRDPEQPGPSNAAYRMMQAQPAFDSDDDSIDLEKPLF